jgi:hypothetical protein
VDGAAAGGVVGALLVGAGFVGAGACAVGAAALVAGAGACVVGAGAGVVGAGVVAAAACVPRGCVVLAAAAVRVAGWLGVSVAVAETVVVRPAFVPLPGDDPPEWAATTMMTSARPASSPVSAL